jgi:hypothetical protein
MTMIDTDQQDPPPERPPDDYVTFWMAQLDAYDKDFKEWERRSARIVRRYRDEREQYDTLTRFNILWSNIQTLSPALYSRIPKPLVERRFEDADPIGRTASQALERALEVTAEIGGLDASVRAAVLDYLLVARGVVWDRYEPTYGEVEPPEEGAEAEPAPVTYEKVCTDYIYWRDFRHTPARIWPDVWWVAKRDWMTRKEGVKRFGKKFNNVPMKARDANDPVVDKQRKEQKACVWEIWDKQDRKVIFLADGYLDEPLEVKSDPLKLEGFWPCPKPLYATVTNDSLVPIPDYLEYQDQARELDSLSGRITALTKAIKAAGVYDKSVPSLVRLLQEGNDNTLFPVDSWTAFSEKKGLEGSISMLPIKDMAAVLESLYNSRDRIKQDLYEITGISDIVRGQGDAKETATAQRIKGQFSNLRLQSRQTAVAEFARDTLAIAGEIIAEHFSPETIAQMTNIMPVIMEEIPEAPAQPTAPQQPPAGPPQGMPGQPGMEQGIGMGAPQPPQPDPAQMQMMQQQAQQQRQMQAQQIFQEAMKLLRDDKLRTFRIDIETDSTIEPDAAEAKQAATELLTGVMQALSAAGPILQMAPELAKPIGDLTLMTYRRHRIGRAAEGALTEAVDQLVERLKNPPPPQPDPAMEAEKVRADAEMQKAQMGLQTEQMKQQGEAAKIQGQMALNQQQLEIKQQELIMKERELQLKERQMMIEMQMDEQRMQMEARQGQQQIDMKGREMEMQGEAMEHKFSLDQQTREAKAREAQKPKPAGKK